MNAFEVKPQEEAGKLRVLGLVSDQRTDVLKDVKTLKEQGIDVVLYVQRGVAAPAEIPDQARTFLISMFRKMSETKEWREYLNQEMLAEGWVEGDSYRKFLEESREDAYTALVTKVWRSNKPQEWAVAEASRMGILKTLNLWEGELDG